MSAHNHDFEEIYTEFRPKIVNYLSRLIRGNEIEDLTQEVFIKVNKGLPNFNGDSKLSTWIYRIATNTALDRMRSPDFKRIHHLVPEDGLSAGDGVEWTDKNTLPADEQLIENEMNACIRSDIDDLSEKYRIVLVLGELQGLKNREIAEILDISLESVKIRLHRARKLLKNRLENHCSFYRNPDNKLACVPK
ncbi:MAG: sigma-70 family RNA polymerase sigma factor [Proteobacteria bacterium]|nr:sigma-70 family RNA polymerase sigma factor [Pseudomonadota bacterium]